MPIASCGCFFVELADEVIKARLLHGPRSADVRPSRRLSSTASTLSPAIFGFPMDDRAPAWLRDNAASDGFLSEDSLTDVHVAGRGGDGPAWRRGTSSSSHTRASISSAPALTATRFPVAARALILTTLFPEPFDHLTGIYPTEAGLCRIQDRVCM